ncbi:MAG: DUF4040 domain-containing protein [Leptospira sp.]|nr:DUF4040 domain-containing protein [Leptospira sp.]
MLIAVFSGIIVSFLLLLTKNFWHGKRAILISILPLSLFAYFLSFLIVGIEQPVRFSYAWIPSLGINLDFHLDGLSMIYALLITGIGSLVFLYSSSYIHHYEARFYGFMSLFMSAMLGMVLSDNMIVFFIFWELTSISSFFLIGFDRENDLSRKSAVVALAITGGGGLFLFMGLIFLGTITGSYSFQNLANYVNEIKFHPYHSLILIFVLLGAFTKSAQFPFQFWLPGAMKAPTPVSTYLHSATMVKAGIYLLARLTPSLGNEYYWNTTLLVIGGLTMVIGAVRSIFHTDLKSILAYTTISALGILVFLIGMGTKEAYTAAMVFILVHAFYKAGFFLVTGILDHKTGTRDITKLRGLGKLFLPVAIAGLLLSISNAGAPPSFGFVGKDLIYEAALAGKYSESMIILIPFVTNVFLIVAGFLVGIRPFWGTPILDTSQFKKPSPFLWAPPLLLSFMGILFGFFPHLLENTLIQPALSSFKKPDPNLHLALWHGVGPVLFWSLATLAVGSIIYFFWKPKNEISETASSWDRFSPSRIITESGIGFEKFSYKFTRFWMNDHLRYYVITILVFLTSLLVFFEFYIGSGYRDLAIDVSQLSEVTYYEFGILVLLLVAIGITVVTRSRLFAIASLGIAGLAICLVFVFYSAPDLAMTQFSIDTLTVVLFVLILYRLPKFREYSSRITRIRDGILALTVGGLITVILLQVLQLQTDKAITDYYLENAYKLAKGKNVVNVILVDFRGMDTMIEIIVLSMAAVGVFSLLQFKRDSGEEGSL